MSMEGRYSMDKHENPEKMQEQSAEAGKVEAKAAKEPPKGKVISSDYRELFQTLEEKEQKQHLEAESTPAVKKPAEAKRRSDPAAAVKAAVKAAQEGFDLLQETPAEEPEPVPPEEEPELEEELEPQEQEPRFRARGKHRRPGLITGVIVLLLALVGVGYLATAVGTQIYRTVTDDTQERNYDQFIKPVVMQDPAAFSSQEDADQKMVLAASLWKALEDNSAVYTDYDDAGRTLVPLSDVSDACHQLFGPEAELQLSNLDADTFFTFDQDTNQFHVTPYSTQSSFIPYTESIWNEDGKTILRVGYVAPTDSWRSDESSAVEEPSPVKYMEYVLDKADGEGEEYIAGVRVPEDGGTPVSSQ